ncbi:DNA-binding protein [Burkholderia pseudomallei]|nr:ATP-binding protein [Burkholderia pseudomallei]CAJ9607220.1 DNA-binding protein [Burkholderia pseudomallei]
MAIRGFDEAEFKAVLKSWLHVSKPISSMEYLMGREQQREQIKRALGFDGRHIFIYGDRGVGKTSLALTAAFENCGDFDPILVGCQPSTTFQQIISNVGGSVQERTAQAAPASRTHRLKLGGKVSPAIDAEVGYEYEVKYDPRVDLATTFDLNQAISYLRGVSKKASANLLVVVDEFDRIEKADERKLFADFVKQVSDQEAPVQFIFCGVGSSLEELLAAHESSQRYFEGIPLSRLMFGSRYEIIEKSAGALGIDVPENIKFRIAAISDGFPHYVHLICSNLYWEIFQDEAELTEPTSDHYFGAIRSSVASMEGKLRPGYDRAIARDDKNFEMALWSAADHSDLQRSLASIFESYKRIAGVVQMPAATSKELTNYLGRLRTPAHNKVLKLFRRGWYEFSENVIRGYVRLRAEDAGCPLALEFDAPALAPSETVGISRVKQRPLPIPRSSFGRGPRW